jgi:hypothetical protein
MISMRAKPVSTARKVLSAGRALFPQSGINQDSIREDHQTPGISRRVCREYSS